MNKYEAKNLEEVLQIASKVENTPVEDLKYVVLSETKGLFSKKCEIAVYGIADVIEYVSNYLVSVLASIGIVAETKASLSDDVININFISDQTPRIIGKNGETLKALNELARSVTYVKYNEHYRILLNADGYKDKKYEKLINMALRIARDVKRTGVTATLDPMTSDERRVIHSALSNDSHIKTQSEGSGKFRHLTIQYVKVAPAPVVETKEVEEVNEESKADITEEKRT